MSGSGSPAAGWRHDRRYEATCDGVDLFTGVDHDTRFDGPTSCDEQVLRPR